LQPIKIFNSRHVPTGELVFNYETYSGQKNSENQVEAEAAQNPLAISGTGTEKNARNDDGMPTDMELRVRHFSDASNLREDTDFIQRQLGDEYESWGEAKDLLKRNSEHLPLDLGEISNPHEPEEVAHPDSVKRFGQ
jgi:hypothetical protein